MYNTIKRKKIKIFYFIVILICFLAILILLIKIYYKNKSDKENMQKYNYNPQDARQLEIPNNTQIICLQKDEFPENLNIFKNLDNALGSEIINYLKKDIVENTYDKNNDTIILNIKPELKFETGELINSKTLKYTLKKYLDCGYGRKLLEDHLDNVLTTNYIMEYNQDRKRNLFNDLINIDSDDKIKLRINNNIVPNDLIKYLNEKIFCLPLEYGQNDNLNNFVKEEYGNKRNPICSYGDYKIVEFSPQKMKLLLQKNLFNNDPQQNILYLSASKKEQHDLFQQGKLSFFEPLEEIEEDISYNDHLFNENFLKTDHKKEFKLKEEQLFLFFNLTTKQNSLKSKMIEQLNYFKDYFSKLPKKNKVEKVKEVLELINDPNKINEIYQNYNLALEDIFSDDKESLQQHKQKLEKWDKIQLPHKILQDPNFRKAFYLAINRQQIIKEILPFYQPSCYPISPLSEFHYSKKTDMSKNLFNFLNLNEISNINEQEIIEKSFCENEAKRLFKLAWDKLEPELQTQQIVLKTNTIKDERLKSIFNYLKTKIANIFDNKIILNNCLTKNKNLIEEITQQNEQGENLSAIIEDLDNDSDLCIDIYPTQEFMNIMLVLLTRFYQNYIFNIDFDQELRQISDKEKEFLKKKFKYSSFDFEGMNEQNKLEGDMQYLFAFYINCKNSHNLNKETKQKIILKLIQEIDKIYFDNLPTIPLLSLQNVIIYKN
jgi:ABC-type transport system substrate-binding protein